MNKSYMVSSQCSVVLITSGCSYIASEQQVKKEATPTKDVPVNKPETGLTHTILKAAPAHAKKPTAGAKVAVHYTGWLDDNGKEGKKFDSSVELRGEHLFLMLGSAWLLKVGISAS